jgi:hypothetical protein
VICTASVPLAVLQASSGPELPDSIKHKTTNATNTRPSPSYVVKNTEEIIKADVEQIFHKMAKWTALAAGFLLAIDKILVFLLL